MDGLEALGVSHSSWCFPNRMSRTLSTEEELYFGASPDVIDWIDVLKMLVELTFYKMNPVAWKPSEHPQLGFDPVRVSRILSPSDRLDPLRASECWRVAPLAKLDLSDSTAPYLLSVAWILFGCLDLTWNLDFLWILLRSPRTNLVARN